MRKSSIWWINFSLSLSRLGVKYGIKSMTIVKLSQLEAFAEHICDFASTHKIARMLSVRDDKTIDFSAEM